MSDLKEKHPTIHLHIYKIKKGIPGVVKDEKGKVVNDNHKVSLPFDTMEWNNWLKQVIPSGIIKIDVIGFAKIKTDENGHYVSHTFVDVPEEVEKKVQDSLVVKLDIKLTPEQKEIAELKKEGAELKAMVKAMQSGNSSVVEDKSETPPELVEAKEKYVNIFGKKGHHLWSLETIKEKIAEKQKEEV